MVEMWEWRIYGISHSELARRGDAANHKIGIEKRERLDKVETLFLLQETYNLMYVPSLPRSFTSLHFLALRQVMKKIAQQCTLRPLFRCALQQQVSLVVS